MPLEAFAIAIPTAAEIDVEECPTPKASYSLSEILGKPDKLLKTLSIGFSEMLIGIIEVK